MARRSHRHHSRAIVRVVRATAARARPIIIRAGGAVRKGARHVRHHAGAGKYRMGAILGGAALGFIDKPGGPLAAVPTLPFLGRAGTLGLAAWAIGKWTKSTAFDHAATGMLAIAAYELMRDGSISGYVAGGEGVMGGF